MCVNKLPRVALDSGEAGIRTCDLFDRVLTTRPPSHTSKSTKIGRARLIVCVGDKAADWREADCGVSPEKLSRSRPRCHARHWGPSVARHEAVRRERTQAANVAATGIIFIAHLVQTRLQENSRGLSVVKATDLHPVNPGSTPAGTHMSGYSEWPQEEDIRPRLIPCFLSLYTSYLFFLLFFFLSMWALLCTIT